MSPLLTIITRTFLGRPAMLKRCRESVLSQVRLDLVEHLMFIDYEKRGVEWSHENLHRVSENIHGKYVLLLDDDDFLIDDYFTEEFVKDSYSGHDVYVYRMDMSNGLILPMPGDFDQRPRQGRIAMSCFVVKREVWIEHAKDFAPVYEGDFLFIDKVWEHGHSFRFIDQVIAKVGRVSHGQPEDSSFTPVSVSSAAVGAMSVQPF